MTIALLPDPVPACVVGLLRVVSQPDRGVLAVVRSQFIQGPITPVVVIIHPDIGQEILTTIKHGIIAVLGTLIREGCVEVIHILQAHVIILNGREIFPVIGHRQIQLVIPKLVQKPADVLAKHVFIIICGVTIGEGALIGAGSVVTKNVPAGEVWVGNPAKFLRKV